MFKFILVCLLINCSCGKYLYRTKYLSVPVDHFGFANNASFKLRYLINDTYWDSNGPIFFYTGNEGNITVFAENTGFIWEIANDFGALIVFAEHRYYGESLPFGNMSLVNNSYLGYLSSSQALADYVYLIDYLQSNKNYADNNNIRNPVIAFGGSYGGMLAAWIRMKYPASVLGAIASSAPIYQFQGLTPCETYNDILTSIYNVSSSNNCAYIIKKSWAALRKILSSPNETEWLISTWQLCKPIQTTENIAAQIIDWLTNVYSNLAMANYPYPANFLASLPAHPVREFCKKLKSEDINDKQLLIDLGNALQIYSNFTGKTKCININSSTTDIGENIWDYQACTEMVMPMCSNKFSMFEEERWNFTKYSADCTKRFGVQPIRQDLAILEYGGKDIKSASNIVFSNGLLDPWSGGGVLQDVSLTVQAVLIPDGAHHIDLRSYNELDPKSVINTRKFHQKAIHHWLKSYKKDNLGLNNVNIANNYIKST